MAKVIGVDYGDDHDTLKSKGNHRPYVSIAHDDLTVEFVQLEAVDTAQESLAVALIEADKIAAEYGIPEKWSPSPRP